MTRDGQLPKSDIKETRHKTNKLLTLFILPLLVALASCGPVDGSNNGTITTNNSPVKSGEENQNNLNISDALQAELSQQSFTIEKDGRQFEGIICDFSPQIISKILTSETFWWYPIFDGLPTSFNIDGHVDQKSSDTARSGVVILWAGSNTNITSEEVSRALNSKSHQVYISSLDPQAARGFQIVISPTDPQYMFGLQENAMHQYHLFCYPPIVALLK